LIILFGWTTTQTEDIKKADWLIGTWENITPRGSIYESWSKINDNEFSGKSYILRDDETIVSETIQLVQEQDGLFYIPTVKNQNEGLPVRFSTKTISETQMIFENLQHDFPQFISYTKITSDSLVAEIWGMRNGQERKLTFPMKRVE
jgi:hypothetical protein